MIFFFCWLTSWLLARKQDSSYDIPLSWNHAATHSPSYRVRPAEQTLVRKYAMNDNLDAPPSIEKKMKAEGTIAQFTVFIFSSFLTIFGHIHCCIVVSCNKIVDCLLHPIWNYVERWQRCLSRRKNWLMLIDSCSCLIGNLYWKCS